VKGADSRLYLATPNSFNGESTTCSHNTQVHDMNSFNIKEHFVGGQ